MFKTPEQLADELRAELRNVKPRGQTAFLLVEAASKIDRMSNSIRNIFDQKARSDRKTALEIESVINESTAQSVPALRHELRRLADMFHERADNAGNSDPD